jgi:class 3 adenylate cyclase/tetratricopeptide (TPR) repeat protein
MAIPSAERRKTVTIVFSDLEGSTALGEALDPEALREVMTRYFDTFRQVLLRHGGTVEKYIGDAVMAVFGLDRAHEDDALRAVRAAAEMRASLTGLNDELQRTYGLRLVNRTGVHTGEVVAGDPAAGQRLVTGDAVNTAARLEQAAPRGAVLISDSTFRLVADAVDVEPVPPVRAKGKAAPIRAWQLISADHAGQGVARRLDIPLVGRSQDLGVLLGSFEEAVATGSCRLVAVLGEAGVGKSRLVAEVTSTVSDRALVLRGRCLSYGEGITFWPLAEVVREAAGILEEDSRDDARARIDSVMAGAAEAAAVAERLASVLGLVDEVYSVQDAFWAGRSLFQHLGAERPVVVVFEDLHWAEDPFLEFVASLPTSVRGPVTVVCSSRPELAEHSREWLPSVGQTLWLGPLSKAESDLLVHQLLEAQVPGSITEKIVGAAEGNPLFTEQIVSMWIEEGVLSRRGNGWVLQAEEASLHVPRTIGGLITARLDQLRTEERSAADRASVAGMEFSSSAIVALSPRELQEGVKNSLLSLVDRRLTVPVRQTGHETGYRFAHALIRDGLYDGLLKRTRSDLHERFADWLVERSGHRLAEVEEIVAFHLEQSARYLRDLSPGDEQTARLAGRAVEALSAVGRLAVARGDSSAAAKLLDRAMAFLSEGDARRLALLPELGEALINVGAFERAHRVLDDGRLEAARAGDDRLAIDLRVVGGFLLRSRSIEGWRTESLAATDEAIGRYRVPEDHERLARAWILRAFAEAELGEAAGRDALEKASSHAALATPPDVARESLALTYLTGMYFFGSTPAPEAIHRCAEVLDRTQSSRFAEANTRANRAAVLAMRGRFDEARQDLIRSQTLFEQLGWPVDSSAVGIRGWYVERLAGDHVAAERWARTAVDVLEAVDERWQLGDVLPAVADSLHEQGRDDEALALCERCESLVAADDWEGRALCDLAKAKVLARRGALQEAIRLARRGATRFVENKQFNFVGAGEALLDLATVLRLGGSKDQSSGAARQALEVFEVKGNIPSAARARAMLTEDRS